MGKAYAGSGEPLGGHLTAAVREKIGKGEYVGIFSLHYTEPEPKTVQQRVMVIKEQEQYKHPKVAFNTWLPAFLIYVTAFVRVQPAKYFEMIKYICIIFRAFSSHKGLAWLSYDQAFCIKAAMQPDLPWDKLDIELWVKIIAFDS